MLAAHSAAKVTTFTGTVSLQGTFTEGGSSSSLDVVGTASGQLSPALEISENFPTFSVGGENLGPVGEIFSASSVYLKLGALTQSLGTLKPWIELPISGLSAKSGINLGSLIGRAQSSSPLASVQLLDGASDVKKVGTSTIAGTPVTEYSGTITMAKAIADLPADTRAGLQKALAPTGIKTAAFKVWLNSDNQALKEVVVEHGTTVSETTTITLTSVNKPVTITPPPASQVTAFPASALDGS